MKIPHNEPRPNLFKLVAGDRKLFLLLTIIVGQKLKSSEAIQLLFEHGYGSLSGEPMRHTVVAHLATFFKYNVENLTRSMQESAVESISEGQ